MAPFEGGDHEFMIPLGGRLYIPSPLPSNAGYGYYSPTCYSCTTRGGWGGYGLASARYFLDDNRNFHLGTTVQFVSASTNGPAVGDMPGIQTTDHWTNVLVEWGLSF